MNNIYGYIYIIKNKVNNKLYIGQTTNSFKERYGYNLKNNTHNNHLRNSIEKYGIDNFEIIDEFDIAYSKEELDKLEDMYIKIYNTIDYKYGYNKKYGGHNGKWTNESKAKMSKSQTGVNNSFYGKHHSKETKELIKISSTGENNGMYGKHHSEETKNKIRNKHIGKMTKGTNPKAHKVICITTGVIFDCIKEAADYYNIPSGEKNIPSACAGRLKHCGRLNDGTLLEWKYYEDYDVNNNK